MYIKEGNYLWNSGMFLWKTKWIINEIKRCIPNTYEVLNNLQNLDGELLQKFINENYSKTDNISIDYAVLEKSDNIYVIPSNIGWDDIGTWKAVERYKEKDLNDNIASDNVNIIKSRSNMVVNNQKKVVLIGIDDVMTLETEDSIFIVNKKYMDNLRDYQKYI